jgi:hypothetical protein
MKIAKTDDFPRGKLNGSDGIARTLGTNQKDVESKRS